MKFLLKNMNVAVIVLVSDTYWLISVLKIRLDFCLVGKSDISEMIFLANKHIKTYVPVFICF